MKHQPYITPEMEKAIRAIVRDEINADRQRQVEFSLPIKLPAKFPRVEWNPALAKWERL